MSTQKAIFEHDVEHCHREKVSESLAVRNQAGELACPTCGEVLER